MISDLYADLILTAANIITINPAHPRAEAVAVRQGRIVAVGSAADVGSLRGRGTEVLNLKGRTVVPGFNEAHNHMISFGMQLKMVPLKYPAIRSIPDIIQTLKDRASTQKPGTWVMGSGYDNTKLTEQRHPSCRELDRVSTEHYVMIRHTSGHMCVVNSKVLELVGITADSVDPEGGHIDRNDRGEPTGLLQENAQQLVTERFFPYPVNTVIEALEAANKIYLSEGITSQAEAGIGFHSNTELLAYQEAIQQGKLNIRSSLMILAEVLKEIDGAESEQFFALSQGIRTGWGDEKLRIGPLKIFSDGSIIGRTAAVNEPFDTDPGNIGFFATEESELRELIIRGHRSGWQLAVHACGDRAVTYILSCYEEAMKGFARTNIRHRIEHCAMVNPQLLEKINELGVIPVPQQHFIGELGDGFITNIGSARARWCYPQRSYLDRGIPIPGSSDRPVVKGAPLLGIHDAVNQRTDSGQSYAPEEKITPEEAIRAYTLHSAYASFEENIKGSIEVGKLADFTILGADPTQVDPAQIAQIPVQGTIIGGQLLYENDLW
ncbi:MAG: amidohydrolase [Deltaproteobacteria bacterium]|nr:amidohydrolase [Deltaproteobacteria bacterium]